MINYDSSKIKIFRGLEAVRKRPGMYIGNTEDGTGLHKMIFEVVDNSIDEYLMDECKNIQIILRNNGYVTIIDDGRGMPVDKHEEEGVSAAEVIMTVLHSGAKFDDKSYKVSGGLHGVGISVVNALSSNLILKIYRNGFIYEQSYSLGKPLHEVKVVGETLLRGTEISFIPDSNIFSFINFNYQCLFDRFIELAFLNSGIKIVLLDERLKSVKQNVFFETGGLKSFLEYLNKDKKIVNKDVIFFSESKNDVLVNIGIQWTESSSESIFCYTNNIFQRDGGSHLIALKSSLTRVIKLYIDEFFSKSNNVFISGDDVREGVVIILSIYMANPKFSSQIKEKLISTEARQAVEYVVFKNLKDFFYENPNIAKSICLRVISAAKAREAAKQARDLSKKKNGMEFVSLYGKLADCQESNPFLSEIFLVEGDSAGGSAKQARDRRTQAVLPLKGKILNVERSGFDKVFSSLELKSVVSALKCCVGVNEYDISNLRYRKIIFMTDADVDGAHIKTLLLTFFYRHMPFLIENGCIFISNPPLYRISNKDESFYVKDKQEFNDFICTCVFEKLKSFLNFVDINFFNDFTLEYKNLINVFDILSNFYPRFFFEKFIYFNTFIPDFLTSSFVDKVNMYGEFLNSNFFPEFKVSFNFSKMSDGFIDVNFFNYGVLKKFKLDVNFFSSNEYKFIFKFNAFLNKFFVNNNDVKFDGVNYSFCMFTELISSMSNKILSSYFVQRYKGLGEMNPPQLWETAMNPKTRNLKLMKIKDAEYASKIFSSLMGGNIEARKKIIDKNISSNFDLDF
ncbi:DNA gyrase subunit B [Candidatus Azoamicus ciliaticola]|uniref:DNA gyrase subunit B n=1 Tax=Candidatus Azoamicus ciliaticola TaxID=2652803 RepID=A0A6J5JVD4_9GAMM|nr:DNA gyrase subunit B [Candidatus Azoamicus ciliaticola]CAB3976248.1 DNA gyrase subunit B [Candidatus Azoamicus ciliaticola]